MADLIFNGTIDTDGSVTSEVVVVGNSISGQIVGGPPGEAATIAVGTVDTVAPGDPATVTNSGDSTSAVFDFEIPQGNPGNDGVMQSVVAGTGVDVDATDPANPEVSLDAGTQASLALADSAVQDLTDLGITASSTEINYVDGVTSSVQTQLDGKVPTSRTVNGQALSSNVTLTQDNVADGSTYKQYSQTEKTKLAGIETGADVTDTANVTSAGALMDSEVTNLAAVKAFDPTDYATAAQGATADTALQPGEVTAGDVDAEASTDGYVLTSDGAGGAAWEAPTGGGVSDWGDIGGTLSDQTDLQDALDDKQDILTEGAFVDGDKTKLDGIEAGADVTDATNVDAAGATMNSDTSLTGNGYFLDQDDMSSNDATKVPSQQSVKAYADTKVAQTEYDPAHEYAVGMYGSRIGMNRWRMSTRDVKHIICWGDSVTQGIGVDSKTTGYPDWLRQIVRNEFNEEVHEGYQPIFWGTGGSPVRWALSSGWSARGADNASNLSPHGGQWSAVRSTSTTLRTLTWTRPSHVKCTKFYIHWVDDNTITSGAKFSYSVDGGSTWAEVTPSRPGTPTHMATLVELDEADYDPTTIIIRNADAAGTTWTNSPVFMGIDIRHSDYGWVVHNMGESGASISLGLSGGSCGAVSAARPAGNWQTLFDYYEPEMVIIEFSNDTTGYVQATFETAIDTACSVLNNYADLVQYGFMEQDRLSGGSNQVAVREHTKDKILEYNGCGVDMYARWIDMTTAKANGFMPSVLFAVHPTELGDKDMASAMARMLRSHA